MQAAGDIDGEEASVQRDGLLITGSHAGERTTVEAVRLEDGVTAWWYDSRLRFEDLVCRDGMVFISGTGRPHPGTLGPAAVTAVRAADGAALWRIGPKQVRRQTSLKRVSWWLRALWMTSSPRSAWQSATSIELAGYTSLAAADGIVVACKESVIFALDARTGKIRWMYPTIVAGARQLITAHGNRVYVHGDHHAFHALDARTGKVRWSSAGRLYIDHLTSSDSLVYVSRSSARGQTILALRAADGGREQALPLADGEKVAGVTGDGIAYLWRQGRLRAARVVDGTQLWQSALLRDAPEDRPASFWPAVSVEASKQAVFYGYESLKAPEHQAVVGALDAATGARLWEWRGPELPIPIMGTPRLRVARGNVHVIHSAGIFAFQGSDGMLLWQAPGGVGIARAEVCVGAGDGKPA